jgi:hypothetical protein
MLFMILLTNNNSINDSPSWEIRHGAGIGLRTIFKRHAPGMGKLGNN